VVDGRHEPHEAEVPEQAADQAGKRNVLENRYAPVPECARTTGGVDEPPGLEPLVWRKVRDEVE
jgi:hypothetical protein